MGRKGQRWAYRNVGLYTSSVSNLKSHKTTNGDFRLGSQRAKLTLFFFFFPGEKGTCFSKARNKMWAVGGYASHVQINIT